MSKLLKSIYAGVAILALASTATVSVFPALSVSAEEIDKSAPIITGIDAKENDNGTVTFTVNATGGEVGNNLLFYKFYTLDKDGNKVPINQNKGIGQNYSTENTYVCKPGTDGKFRVYVEVENSENEVVNDTKTYEIKKDDPDEPVKNTVKINKIISDVTQDTVVGDKVNISADVTSNDKELKYKFTVCDLDGSIVFSKETSESSVAWTPKKADEFVIKVEVTDSKGNTSSDNKKVVIGTSKDDTAEELEVKLSLSSEDVYVNKTVTLRAETTGGIGEKKYKFKDTTDSSSDVLRDYEEGKEIDWTPTTEGTHILILYVRDSSGIIKSAKVKLNVKPQEVVSDKPSTKPGDSDKPGKIPDKEDNTGDDVTGGSQGGGSDVGGGDNNGNNTGDLTKGILPIGTFAVMSLAYVIASLKKKNK